MSKKIQLLLIVTILFSALLLFPFQTVHASILDDVLGGVKNFFSPTISPQLNLTSKIELAPNGDVNKNGQIDAGDTLRFSYNIMNPTSNTYSFATLKTNINTDLLNSPGNLQGALNLNDSNHTITIPNLHINQNQQLIISFEARSNFNKDSDQIVSSEPEVLNQNNGSLYKATQQQATIKKMGVDDFNKFVHITK